MLSVPAQQIVPFPLKTIESKGNFVIDNNTKIVTAGNLKKQANFLKDYLIKFYNLPLNIQVKKPVGNTNYISLQTSENVSVNGAYDLDIMTEKIEITSSNDEGIFYGIQSLLQLIPVHKNNSLQISCKKIQDEPRFQYRGMHLDVARHFYDVAYVKKYIDLLAYHKFNKFHWHLTDDQGWRIEIKKYPLLTEIGSCRAQTLVGRFGSDVYDGKMHKGYYTQDQIREVVQYAADRFITVIPEIDIPGHSLAALASYPFLGCTKGPYKVRETWAVQPDVFCAGNDSTYTFIENVMNELITLFPSEYIHIGGDECPKERWKACPVCQNKMHSLSLKDEHALQSYFVQRLEKYLNSKGKKIIGWDEILEGGLAPNAAVMSWRGTKGGIAAARQKHEVIMTPEDPLYLNLSQSKNEDSITQGGYNSLEKVYAFEAIPKELDSSDKKFVLGLQGEMWTEYISNPSKLEYMLFPRMSAVAEAAWTNPVNKNFERFNNQLPELFKRYKLWQVNYSTAYFDLQSAVIPFDNQIAWKLETKNKNKIIYLKPDNASKFYEYKNPVLIDLSGEWSAAVSDSSEKLKWIRKNFQLNKASGKKIILKNEPNQKYAGESGFTLIDGIQNTTGMLHGSQFLGFIGTDMEVTIDLKESIPIDSIKLHCFQQPPSWIYPPSLVEFSTSVDSTSFSLMPQTQKSGIKHLVYKSVNHRMARYVKIKAFNNGIISKGLPGAGGKAWLFADEIEIF